MRCRLLTALIAINSGTYKSSAAGWVSGLSITDAQNSALKWAQEANAYVCSTVLAKGITYVESTDLSGSYYTTATPVVSLQIAKQGYRYVLFLMEKGLHPLNKGCRLAKWLDAIAAAA